MMIRTICLLLVWFVVTLMMQTQDNVTITQIADGLLNPVGMAQMPNGNILIAEEGTGEDDNSAGISLLTPDGQIGRLVSGFPSGRDSGDLSGIPLVAMSPDETTIYFSHFNAQQLFTLPISMAQVIPESPYTLEDVGVAMERLNRVYLINPFDMTFSAEGDPIVTDASGNGVATQTMSGKTRFFHRFDELDNPNSSKTIEAVPTGITRVNDEYYVTLFGGCPYPADSGKLVAIDMERNQRTILDNLSMPIDVEMDDDGNIWVLEFGTFAEEGSCFSGAGYQPETGRLSRLNADGTRDIIIDGLDFPGAILPLSDGSLLISEIFAGRLLQIEFTEDEDTASANRISSKNVGERQRWHFQDVAQSAGLDFIHGAFAESVDKDDHIAMMGAGVCWIDYDKDGWLDVYLVNSHATHEISYWQVNGGLPTNGLYRNVSGQFVDVSEDSETDLAMRGNGCVAADFNNDGWDDLYITADEANALLYNNGDGTFTEGAKTAGVNVPDWNSAIAVADINRDGWLDIFVGGYIDLENPVENPIGAFPQDYDGIPDRLFLNNGVVSNGQVTFTEVTQEAGLLFNERTLGAIFTDVDNDADLDLYIANDGEPNRLYLYESVDNTLDFNFVDTYDTSNIDDRGSGMGVASGDWTGDGWTDLIVTNWDRELNAIYRNATADMNYPHFEYLTYRIGMQGLGNNTTGWGVHFVDFDHDIDLDMMIVNGRVPITNPDADAEMIRLYTNQMMEGKPDEFRDWTSLVGLRQVGRLMARGSAVADYDNDGDLDVVINQIGRGVVLLENIAPQGNWLVLKLADYQPGIKVHATLPDGRVLYRETHRGSSYLASEDPRIHFGVGEFSVVPEIEIIYPTGETHLLTDISVNQYINVSR